MLFRRSRKIVLMERGIKCCCILNAFVSLEGTLLSLPINFEHEIIIPSIVCENCGHAFGDSNCLPIYIVLFPDFVDIVRDEDVVSLSIHLIDSDLQEVVDEANGGCNTAYFDVVVVGFVCFDVHLSFDACEEEFPQWVDFLLIELFINPVFNPRHYYYTYFQINMSYIFYQYLISSLVVLTKITLKQIYQNSRYLIKFIMLEFFTLPVIIAILISALAFLLILEPENLTQNQYESKKINHEFRSSKHKFEKSELKSFYFCYLCHKLISSWFKNDVLECKKCGIVIHRFCQFLKFRKKPECKYIIAKHMDKEDPKFYHQWRQCSYSTSTSCSVCDSLCVGVQTYLCIWCHRVKHGSCDGTKFPCDYGHLRKFILQPTDIYCPNISSFASKAFVSLKKSNRKRKEKTSDDSSNPSEQQSIEFKVKDPNKRPFIVIINKKSGGQTGNQFIKAFYQALNPLQVISILDQGLQKLKVFIKIPNILILVAGGDGTVCSVINYVKTIPGWDKKNPPVAVLPLGTGNDLSRSLGWGSSVQEVNPDVLIPMINRKGKMQLLDRWKMTLYHKQQQTQKELTLYNYLGLGLDAKICKDFHEIRQKYPQLFFSQFSNKLIYTQMGAVDLFSSNKLTLKEQITVKVNDQQINLDEIQNVIFLNIMHWGGGVTDLWETKNTQYKRQSYSDGLVEVIGLSDIVHMGQVQVGMDSPFILGQGSEILIESFNEKTILPIQIDGQPLELIGRFTIKLSRKDQVNVLATTQSPVGSIFDVLAQGVKNKIINQGQMRQLIQLSQQKLNVDAQ